MFGGSTVYLLEKNNYAWDIVFRTIVKVKEDKKNCVHQQIVEVRSSIAHFLTAYLKNL